MQLEKNGNEFSFASADDGNGAQETITLEIVPKTMREAIPQDV